MSTPNQGKRSRWMAWEPKGKTSPAVEAGPAEPSEPGSEGFEGFDGATSGKSEKIRGNQEPSTLAACGPPHCGGCYEVAPGVRLHPPKISPEWTEYLKRCREQGRKVQ